MSGRRPWVLSRAAVALLVLAGGVQVLGERASGFVHRWDRWDTGYFVEVARVGYGGYPAHPGDKDIAAFFPGLPLVLRAVHVVVPDWTAAGLLVSLVAGAVASVHLARLAALDGVDGGRAVLYLVLSPYAVFLAAGYSEALFLALALPGWLAARRGQWPLASLLVAGACAVRVSGAFLAAGLAVEFAVTCRQWRRAPWLAAPVVVLGGFAAYLHSVTGDWLARQHAQAQGWGRHLTDPLTALRTTVDAARSTALGPEYQWSFRAEIVAVAVGLALTAVLLARRSWGEATYVGLSVAALATSSFYLSVARATLLWFPLWLLLAEVAARRPWLHTAYVAVATPLMAASVLTFTAGRWV
ncbi:MAG: mannosyltransferase family protein, partial [Mycobacteriales bacterium]